MIAINDKQNKNIITKSALESTYQRRESLADWLPWHDYNHKHKCFLLNDNMSLATCFKIKSIACEARPAAMLEEITKSLSEALKNSIPLEKDNPWILQTYFKTVNNLDSTYKQIESYFPEERKSVPFVKDFLNT